MIVALMVWSVVWSAGGDRTVVRACYDKGLLKDATLARESGPLQCIQSSHVSAHASQGAVLWRNMDRTIAEKGSNSCSSFHVWKRQSSFCNKQCAFDNIMNLAYAFLDLLKFAKSHLDS